MICYLDRTFCGSGVMDMWEYHWCPWRSSSGKGYHANHHKVPDYVPKIKKGCPDCRGLGSAILGRGENVFMEHCGIKGSGYYCKKCEGDGYIFVKP